MNCLEIFSGVGGMALGLEAAGFQHLDIVDSDQACISTLNDNISKRRLTCGSKRATQFDVREYDFRSFEGKVDLLSGGPPCQPFSFGGSHRAALDHRNMFPQAIRAVRESRPKAFLFENVPGLMRPRFQNYFEYLKLSLAYPHIEEVSDENWEQHHRRLERHHTGSNGLGCEYNLVAQAINAANFGIPQSRVRVFIVGIRSDLGCKWSFPSPTHSEIALQSSKLSGEYFERHGIQWKPDENSTKLAALFEEDIAQLSPWTTLRDAVHDLPDPELEGVSRDVTGHIYKPGARSYKGHTGSVLDLPAKTLKAGVNGVPGGENMMVRDDGSVRYLTIRECARVQTFPDKFEFHDVWSRAARQLGNAVPVELATVLGKSLREALTI